MYKKTTDSYNEYKLSVVTILKICKATLQDLLWSAYYFVYLVKVIQAQLLSSVVLAFVKPYSSAFAMSNGTSSR